MTIIANIDERGAIGYKGKLLYPIKKDLEHFKALTSNKIVVMGRKTLQSLPNAMPLKNRYNIVLSATMQKRFGKNYFGAKLVASTKELFALLNTAPYNAFARSCVFVIGGESVYNSLLPFCTNAIITHVHQTAPLADAFFSHQFDEKTWRVTKSSSIQYDNLVPYQFVWYERI